LEIGTYPLVRGAQSYFSDRNQSDFRRSELKSCSKFFVEQTIFMERLQPSNRANSTSRS